MARSTEFDAEKAAAICRCLANGATRRASAEASGIDFTTLLDWLQRGQQEDEGDLHEFYTSVVGAEADCELMMTEAITKAATGYERTQKHTIRRTVFRYKETHQPDGSVICEPIPCEAEETHTITTQDADPQAAAEWLNR